MTMLELDETTAEELSMFLVDGELEIDEDNVIDILSTIDSEWYFNDELCETFKLKELLNETN